MENMCPVCEKPANKMCSSCRLVSYCSVEHQKNDWKAHKKICRVYEVKENEKYGRYTVAARNISAGTIIMNEMALMVGPKQNTCPVCLGCNKKLTDKVKYYCTQCLIFPLCGESCEKIPIHAENECKIFAKFKPTFKPITDFEETHPAYECIMTLRCLLLKHKDAKRWSKLHNFQPQNETRKSTLPGLWHRNEANTVRLLRDYFQMKEFSEIDIHTVLGYSDINSFEVKIKDIESAGLFENTFLMPHDCISNTSHTFTNDYRMIVRATVEIPKGGLITTSYAHTMDGTLDRREDTRESKLFDCTCKRCSDPTEMGTYFSAVKCTQCQIPDGYLLPIDSLNKNSEWQCSACKSRKPSEDISKLINSIKTEIKSVKENEAHVVQHYEQMLINHSNTLHPNHFLIIDMESSLLSFYGRMKGWLINDLSLDILARKETLCLHVLQILDVIEPGLSRIRGVTLYELHAAIYFSAVQKYHKKQINSSELKRRLEEVLTILNEAKRILSFDSPSTVEGAIANSIPASIIKVKESICEI